VQYGRSMRRERREWVEGVGGRSVFLELKVVLAGLGCMDCSVLIVGLGTSYWCNLAWNCDAWDICGCFSVRVLRFGEVWRSGCPGGPELVALY